MQRSTILQLIAVIGLSLAAKTTGFADFYWDSTAANAAAAGSGTWDNSTVAWNSANDTSPANTAWVDGNNATFEGTSGGNVGIGNDISVNTVTFTSGAGAFILGGSHLGSFVTNDAFNTTFTGGGFVNNSSSTQTFNNVANVYFQGSSSASAGSTTMTINNGGNIFFQGTSDGGTSTINNTGNLDLTGLTSSGIQVGTLYEGGVENLSDKTLHVAGTSGVGTMTIDAATFNMTLDAPSLVPHVSAAFIDDTTDAGDGPSTLNITAGTGFGIGTYTLFNQNGEGAAFYTSDLSNYDLVLPSGVDGTLVLADPAAGTEGGYQSIDLEITAVPEVSSFIIPILGAAGLFWLRRRASVADEMLEIPALS